MVDKIMRRLPATEKSISEINPKKDIRVRITGTVIDVSNDSIMIDDGSGKAEIMFENTPSYIREGQFVRIITRILPLVDGFECRGEVVQNMDTFDVNLYKDSRKIITR